MNDSPEFYYDWSLPPGGQTNDPKYPSGSLPIGKLAPRIYFNGICVNGSIYRATTGESGTVEVYMRAFPKHYVVNPRTGRAYRFTLKGHVTATPVENT